MRKPRLNRAVATVAVETVFSLLRVASLSLVILLCPFAPSFRDGPKDQTSGAQLRTGESRDSGFDASHRPGMTTLHPALQRLADFVEHLGILDRGRHGPGFAVGDLLDGAAQDFSGAGFGQAADRDRELEGGDRAELVAHQRHNFLLDLRRALRDAALQHPKAAGHLAL